jgi:hypothetical protein
MALAGVLVGIAHLRLREANLRAASAAGRGRAERLARHGTQAELKLLQAQVEPHFLFNTLANVRYLVQTGSPDALAMLDHLIRYLRTALPEIRTEARRSGARPSSRAPTSRSCGCAWAARWSSRSTCPQTRAPAVSRRSW